MNELSVLILVLTHIVILVLGIYIGIKATKIKQKENQ